MLTTLWGWPSPDTVHITWMFGPQLCLPIHFYFPMIRGMKKHQLTTMLLSYVNSCGKPLKRLKCSPHQRLRDRSGTMMGKLMPFHWNHVTWSWLKLMPTGGGGKWRTGGRRNCTKWGARLMKASLSHEEPQDRMLTSPPQKLTFLIAPTQRTPLCMIVQAKWARCTITTLEEQTLEGSETDKCHKVQSVHCQPCIRQVRLLWDGWIGNSTCSFRCFQSLLATSRVKRSM